MIEGYVKNGKKNGKQRWVNRKTGHEFIEGLKRHNKPETKVLGTLLYLNGMSFNRVGKLLSVSHVTVMNWVDKLSSHVNECYSLCDTSGVDIEHAEIDELFTFVFDKKKDSTSQPASTEALTSASHSM